jgi:hypothetical protein
MGIQKKSAVHNLLSRINASLERPVITWGKGDLVEKDCTKLDD